MLRVYSLPTIGHEGDFVGREFVHHAFCVIGNDITEILQNTSDSEHNTLAALAQGWRKANVEEIDRFNKSGVAYKPPTVNDLPKSQHLAIVKNIDVTKPKPVTVTRTYEGLDFDIPCVVTQDIKDQFVAGKIAVGDIVIVAYCEEKYDQAIVQSKVFKSW